MGDGAICYRTRDGCDLSSLQVVSSEKVALEEPRLIHRSTNRQATDEGRTEPELVGGVDLPMTGSVAGLSRIRVGRRSRERIFGNESPRLSLSFGINVESEGSGKRGIR